MQIEKETQNVDGKRYEMAEIVHMYENRIYVNLSYQINAVVDCLEFIKRQKPELEELIDAKISCVKDELDFYDYAKMDFCELSDNQKRQHYYKLFYGHVL